MRKLIYILLIILTACQVQKRKYQSGYYVSVHKKPNLAKTNAHKENQHFANGNFKRTTDQFVNNNKASSLLLSLKEIISSKNDSCDLLIFNDGTEIKSVIITMNDKEIRYRYCDDPPEKERVTSRKNVVQIRYARDLYAKPAETAPIVPLKKEEPIPADTAVVIREIPKPVVVPDTAARPHSGDNCAIIYFMDGTERKANVLEIGLSEIKYKDCSMPDGPLFRELKSKIFMIVYANGTREVIEHKKETVQTTEPEEPVTYKRKSAVWPFIFALAGFYPMWFAGSILGIILGASYLSKSRMNPEVYHQGGLAKAALIIGIIGLAIVGGIFFLTSI